jgi:hypothetical protein
MMLFCSMLIIVERSAEQKHNLVRQMAHMVGEQHDIAGSGADTRFEQLVLFSLIGDLVEKGEQTPKRMRAFVRER